MSKKKEKRLTDNELDKEVASYKPKPLTKDLTYGCYLKKVFPRATALSDSCYSYKNYLIRLLREAIFIEVMGDTRYGKHVPVIQLHLDYEFNNHTLLIQQEVDYKDIESVKLTINKFIEASQGHGINFNYTNVLNALEQKSKKLAA